MGDMSYVKQRSCRGGAYVTSVDEVWAIRESSAIEIGTRRLISKMTSTRTPNIARITGNRHSSFGLRFSRDSSCSIIQIFP